MAQSNTVKDLYDQIADAMVQNAAIKEHVHAMLDGYVEDGMIVPSAAVDLMDMFGDKVLKDANGRYVLATQYSNKEGIVRIARQEADFAFRELIAARPHMALPPPPSDVEADAERGHQVSRRTLQ
jgi:hypothetical protein